MDSESTIRAGLYKKNHPAGFPCRTFCSKLTGSTVCAWWYGMVVADIRSECLPVHVEHSCHVPIHGGHVDTLSAMSSCHREADSQVSRSLRDGRCFVHQIFTVISG